MVKRNIYTVDHSRCMTSGTRACPVATSPANQSTHQFERTVSATPMSDDGNSAGCGVGSGSAWGLEGYPLAMVYAPLQNFSDIYSPEMGLSRGTIFAELDLPIGTISSRKSNSGGAMRNG